MIRSPLCALILLIGAAWLVAGCDGEPTTERDLGPVAIESGDECHVCGMIITRFPGPKGEARLRHRPEPLKFCSTRDLFVWLLQPESAAIVEAVYVHDMAQTPWATPGSGHLIPADTAWYVVGSDREGAMGPTLASFAEQQAARRFADEYGGRVLGYEAIDLATLNAMMAIERRQPVPE